MLVINYGWKERVAVRIGNMVVGLVLTGILV